MYLKPYHDKIHCLYDIFYLLYIYIYKVGIINGQQ